MQPYFFPYIGYFSLIHRVDKWVVFDVTQYTPKTWMNRNRVLHPTTGWNWVTVPLAKSSRSMAIRDAMMADPAAAQRSTLGKLSHYRRRAPYWSEVEAVVRAAFEPLTDTSLVGLNVRGMVATCAYLSIDFQPLVCSSLDLDLGPIDGPGGWAPAIAAALGASEYVNPIGGAHLFDPADFAAAGVTLSFLEQPNFLYDTGPYRFEPGLSMLDVLMWNPPSVIRKALESARVVSASKPTTLASVGS